MSTNRLYKNVVEQLLVMIDSGELKEGSRLPAERELAERFNVSRPTIREAIIALEAIGRLNVKIGSGIYVKGNSRGLDFVSGASAFELMESRIMIEGEAAALAASLINSDQIEQLEAALDKMRNENQQDGFGADSADRIFHEVIADATNNKVLQRMIRSLWDTQQTLDHIKSAHVSMCSSDPDLRLKEHEAIVDALRRRDPESARLAMRKHFARAVEAMHEASELEAVQEVKRRLSQARERFSTDRLIN
jgi:DNA-binding FadR family transcriptional regulator